MHQMDYQAFAAALIDLGISRAGKAIDERTIDVYWRGLEDQDWPDVERGLRTLAREGGTRFPALPVVRAAVDAGRRTTDTHERSAWASMAQGEYACLTCLDTGFAYVDGGQLARMDMAVERGLRHVRQCPCRSTNAHYRAKERASRVQRAHRADGER